MTEKKCSKCQETKSIENFYPRKTRENQWASACKSCDSKRMAPKLSVIEDLIETDEYGNIYRERWTNIIGYEGIYQISCFGRVKRIHSRKNAANKLIEACESTGGYLQTWLTVDGKGKSFSTHRLVAIHFIPNPENKPEVNHKKGNKKDNRFFMLEWNTTSENILHSFETGLSDNKGTKHSQSKLTDGDVLEIRASNLTPAQLAKMYDVHIQTIYKILSRKRWPHI